MHQQDKERKEDKAEQVEKAAAPQADPAKPLMARLERVVAALEGFHNRHATISGDGSLIELQAEERITPNAWEDIAFHGKRPVPGWEVALLAANAFVDAGLLKCPGTLPVRAVELVDRLLSEQREHGVFRVHEKDDPGEHLVEWDAAMAAILYVAHACAYPLIEERVAPWWRQMLDSGALDQTPPDIWLFIDHSERVADPSLAARFFYLMENVALPKPAVPWKVVV